MSTSAPAHTQTQSSQISAASSLPASQLLESQIQTESQQGRTQAQTESQSQSQSTGGVPPARLQLFQQHLGQLVTTALFANDAADVEPLMSSINNRVRLVRGQEFDMPEVEACLRELAAKNLVMYEGQIVYRI